MPAYVSSLFVKLFRCICWKERKMANVLFFGWVCFLIIEPSLVCNEIEYWFVCGLAIRLVIFLVCILILNGVLNADKTNRVHYQLYITSFQGSEEF